MAGAGVFEGVAFPAVAFPADFWVFDSLMAARTPWIFDPEMKWRMFECPARVSSCLAFEFTDLTLTHEPTARCGNFFLKRLAVQVAPFASTIVTAFEYWSALFNVVTLPTKSKSYFFLMADSTAAESTV